MSEIGQLIKRLAADAVEDQKPTAFFLGEVIDTAPLRIRIDPQIILTKEYLILTKNVTDHWEEMTVEHETQPVSHSHFFTCDGARRQTESVSHSHTYTGRKRFLVHNGLKKGDRAILLRLQGGQRYLVI